MSSQSTLFRLFALGLLIISPPAYAATSWNLTDEEIAPLSGTVVDLRAIITGEPSRDCGGGKHQLGIKTEEGKLIPVIKNAQPFFGATVELLPFCGKAVTLDGLFTGHSGYRVYVVQAVLTDGAAIKATKGVAEWARRNGFDPAGKEARAWYRHDPKIKAAIAKDGYFGIGQEADAAWLKENTE
jgi:hypothetical protein